MAVQEQTPLQEYTANGIAKQFDLEFDCESADHLIVSIDDLEVLHTDWYLSGNSIVFHVAPASGKQVKIQRNTPFNRLADYQSYNNSFRPPAINKDFDRIWWKLQELGVADWILSNRINALKAYVDDRDDELRAYLMEEIRKQGVALDQLDEYYNYLMERLAQIAVDKGWSADFVVDGNETQHQINNQTVRHVESISDLIAINRPKDGQVVFVKSYNTGQKEGGDFFEYKSSRQLENDGVSIFKGWERQKNGKAWTLEDAGKPTNSTNDSPYLQKIFDLSKEKHTNIILKPDTTYIFKDKVEVTDSKGITLIAYGAKTLIGYHQKTPNDNYQYPFAITCDPTANASVIIKGLNQDGAPSFYNPWEYFKAGKRWYSVVGIKIESAFNVVYEGVTQKNILGYGSQWFDCKNVSVDGFDAKEVGGHNGLFGNDSIGDCFYIGWRSGETKYSFKNVSAKGVSVEDIYSGSYYSPRSRIFITVENLKGSAVDKQTIITLENVKAFDYQRGIHVEANKGEVLLVGDNVDIKADLVCLSSHTNGGSKFSFTNSYLTPNTRDYNGTGGINWGVDLFLGAGCVVDDINRNSKTAGTGLLSHKANNAKFGTMLGKGSRVKNIKGLLANNGKYSADGAIFEFSESYSSYYHYNSVSPVLTNCELLNIENTSIKRISQDGVQFTLKGCTVRNLDFSQDSFKSIPSDLYLNTALISYYPQSGSGRMVNVYLDGVLMSLYSGTVAVGLTSTIVSTDELFYIGKYHVTKGLTNLPAGVTKALIETEVTLKEYFSGYSDSLMQTCTSLTAPYTISRRFRSNTTWSSWVSS